VNYHALFRQLPFFIHDPCGFPCLVLQSLLFIDAMALLRAIGICLCIS
jgi:hypothetical protein